MTLGTLGRPSRPCIFPFEFKDAYDYNAPWIRYDKCATDYDGVAFCPTDVWDWPAGGMKFRFYQEYFTGKYVDQNLTWDEWGHCSPNCPVAPGPGGKLKHMLRHIM